MQSAAPEPAQPPRGPTCTLCKARKVKCDRNNPCSNCSKSGVECVQRTNAKTRNRKKPAAELQQKLALCERLLEQLSEVGLPQSATSSTPSSGNGRGERQTAPLEVSLGKLVIDKGSVRFTDNLLWATLFDELQSMKTLVEDCDNPCSLQGSMLQQSSMSGAGVDILSTQDIFLGDLRSLHPLQSHIMILWQIFLDRISPVTKLVHIPSVQCYLPQAIMEPPCLPPDMEALFFSVYGSAVNSMREEECAALLGESKKDLLSRFTSAIQTALHRSRFLEAPNLLLLQALTLHLIWIPGRRSSHANWVLSGVCIRSAQRLGLHRDGEALGLSTFETEMRRRVWWHIVMLDFRFALNSGFTPTPLASVCDTKMPTNIDDADFDITTTSSLENHRGPTEMIICLITSGLAQCLVRQPRLSEAMSSMETSALTKLSNHPHSAEMARIVTDVEDCLGTIVKTYCDPAAGPLHVAAFQIKSAMTQKIWSMTRGPKSGFGDKSSAQDTVDSLFELSVESTEQFANLLRVMESSNFVWFVLQYFEQDIFMFMLGQLCHRTVGINVNRAWETLPIIYAHHEDLLDSSTESCSTSRTFLLRAWKARQEDVFLRLGHLPEVPGYISEIEQNLGGTSTPYATESSSKEKISESHACNALNWDVMGWGLESEHILEQLHVRDYGNYS